MTDYDCEHAYLVPGRRVTVSYVPGTVMFTVNVPEELFTLLLPGTSIIHSHVSETRRDPFDRGVKGKIRNGRNCKEPCCEQNKCRATNGETGNKMVTVKRMVTVTVISVKLIITINKKTKKRRITAK